MRPRFLDNNHIPSFPPILHLAILCSMPRIVIQDIIHSFPDSMGRLPIGLAIFDEVELTWAYDCACYYGLK
jgi:hypothetical protein